jgi:hypothetical protein
VIVAADVMDLMLESCPSFAATWDPAGNWDDAEGKRLLYIEAGDYCRHVHELLAAGRTEELPAAFALVETLHVEGDSWVRDLATIGFLESLWPDERFIAWLGPVSRRWWDRLDRYMRGQNPWALSVEDPPYPTEDTT